MEKYYGSRGRYTCNGFVPMTELPRKRQSTISFGKVFIAMVALIDVLIIAFIINAYMWR